MAERARLQRNIGRDATNTKKALGDDRSAAQVAAKQAVNAVRPKGDDRSAAQIAAQKAAERSERSRATIVRKHRLLLKKLLTMRGPRTTIVR